MLTIGQSSVTRITIILPSGIVIGASDDDPARMDNNSMRPEVNEDRKGRGLQWGDHFRFSRDFLLIQNGTLGIL